MEELKSMPIDFGVNNFNLLKWQQTEKQATTGAMAQSRSVHRYLILKLNNGLNEIQTRVNLLLLKQMEINLKA